MKIFKKMAAGTLAAVAVVTSALSFGANASEYEDIRTWHLYANPYASHSVENVRLNYYTGGYRARITDKHYGGAANYVLIYAKDEDPNNFRVSLSTTNVLCQTFKGILQIDKDRDEFAAFNIHLRVEDMKSNTPTNDGEIRLSNQF